MINSEENKCQMAGVRIHDYSHPDWKQDVDILVPGAGQKLTYITIPKTESYVNALEMVEYIQEKVKQANIDREIPIHVLIETHGAINDVQSWPPYPGCKYWILA